MSKKISKTRSLAYLALLGNTILWGVALPIVKKGYDFGLTPYTFLTGRMIIAAFFSLPLIFLLRNDKKYISAFSFKNLRQIIPLELLGTTISLALLYEGLKLTSSVESSLITMTAPLFLVLGGILFLHEKEEKHEWFGLILALLGTTTLVLKPLFYRGINGTTHGNLLVFASVLTTVIYLLLAKKKYQPLNKFAITQVSFFVGSLSFIAISSFFNLSPLTSFISLFDANNLWPLIATAYMAVPGSLIALTLYLYGQDKIEASEASLFAYLSPLFTIPAAFILVDEAVALVDLLAVGIIILGVYLAEKR